MTKRYDKLVRDKVPGRIRAGGETPKTHVASPAEFRAALRSKLREEVDEYLVSGDIEELADIMEVVYALAALEGCGPEQLEGWRQRKLAYAGGFSERIILEEA
ncbi:MAG TPA: nucleoside triphosphate pyrophosphohydrolase [Candidatus Paceibacterota bacterium]|nr:nucleoside triphosphate pyrophosphohydrolase [Candidatus Paceibacterota bacterium]